MHSLGYQILYSFVSFLENTGKNGPKAFQNGIFKRARIGCAVQARINAEHLILVLICALGNVWGLIFSLVCAQSHIFASLYASVCALICKLVCESNNSELLAYGPTIMTHRVVNNRKQDQETWLCRTHLDTFWFDFGPYWTNLGIFGPFCLL